MAAIYTDVELCFKTFFKSIRLTTIPKSRKFKEKKVVFPAIFEGFFLPVCLIFFSCVCVHVCVATELPSL